jgi:hypothetical protein
MSYRVLVLPQIDRMTVPVLRKIRELAAGGATIVGPRAVKSPSLAGYPEADREVQALAAEVWGDLDGIMRNRRYYKKGLVTWGLPLPDVLASIRVPKDFEYSRALDSDVPWIHRRAGDTDIYFLANRTDRAQDFAARFRVSGKEAELWHSDTGAVEPAGYAMADGRTTVPLHLAERESVFVVFRRATTVPSRSLPRVQTTTLATVDGPWDLSFPPNMGAPAGLKLAKLESWTASADEGVKYFSGTAAYTKTLQAPDSWLRPGSRTLLDLGAARDVVEVAVNGQAVATLWKPPYQVDVTGVLKPGTNRLEIKVTNEWTNRQVGDRLGPPEKRVLTSDLPAGRGGGAGGPPPAARGGRRPRPRGWGRRWRVWRPPGAGRIGSDGAGDDRITDEQLKRPT